MKSASTAILLAAALTLAACVISAQRDVPHVERRAQQLNQTIMCPVCPGESIDQSQNALAGQMRAIVSEKLAEGWSDDQIRDFFVERYGPSVLLEPPTSGFGLAAWFVPPVAFALALAALLLTLRWMRAAPPSTQTGRDGEDDSARSAYLARLEGALDPDPAEGPPPRPREDGG